MKLNKIDHICIAVKDLAQARKRWEPLLGKEGPDEAYVDEAEKIRVARYYIGGVGLELMESTGPEGEVARFIEKRGEGLMLISFNVDNTRQALAELGAKGHQVIPDSRGHTARPFREGEFGFVHPEGLNRVLVEVIDDKPERPGPAGRSLGN